MRVLAVDTTSVHGSVALLRDAWCEAIVGLGAQRSRHAERLLPTIESVLASLDLSLSGLDGLAVAVGPGSFTGLRVGIATVEGLSFASGLPAVGVSSLEAAAYRYRYHEGRIAVMLEAYRNEIYGQAFASVRAQLRPLTDPLCAPPASFLDALAEPPTLVAGAGALRYRDAVQARCPEALLAEGSLFAADEVARIGAARLAGGERAALGELSALYVRPSEAERNLRRRQESEVGSP